MLTPEWRKSSYSNGQSSCVEVKGVWRKSSYSNGQASCVEVNLAAPDAVAIRDSKNPTGPHLTLTPAAWSSFTTTIKRGNFDV
jgi:Domain of unknown function (DUF397)